MSGRTEKSSPKLNAIIPVDISNFGLKDMIMSSVMNLAISCDKEGGELLFNHLS